MKVTLKKQSKSMIELTIEVPYDAYRKWEQVALAEINKNFKVAGFRSGHIPEEVLRQQAPEGYIQEKVLNFVIPQTYSQAVSQEKLSPVTQPKVEIKEWVKKEGDAFVYTAVVAVMPEVKIGDYKKIKIAQEPVKVTEKQVNEVIGQILDRFATFHAVDRAAKLSDRVEITFEGFDEKGNPVPKTKSINHPLVLGAKTFIEGFEEAVVGMKKGETKEFKVTFPKTYHEKALQGTKVTFKTTLNMLEEKKTPELNEETIEKITKAKQGVDAFRKQVEADLKAELEERARGEREGKILEAVIKITKADLPDALLEEEGRFMLEQQQSRVKEQGLTWEQYLQHVKKTEADLIQEARPQAEKNLLARFGIQSIIREEKIAVNDQEIDRKIQELMASYPEAERGKVGEYYQKGSSGYDRMRNHLAVDKLMALLSA